MLQTRVIESCVSVVRDRRGIIPYDINRDTRVLHLVIMNNHEDYRGYINAFTKELKAYSDVVEEVCNPGPDWLFKSVRNGRYDLIICNIGNIQAYGTNVLRLHGPIARNMMYGWMRFGTPVIFVAPLEPFIHLEYYGAVDTIINTYGINDGLSEIIPRIVLEGVFGKRELNRNIVTHDI